MEARQLLSCQAKCVPDDLFVDVAPDLKEDLVDCHPGCPVIERSLSLTHTHLFTLSGPLALQRKEKPWKAEEEEQTDLVAADEDADITAHPLVETVLLATQALLDGVLGDLELLGADAAVVVGHAQAVVPPHDGGALGGAAGGTAGAALHHLLLAVDGGLEPVAGPGRRRGEHAHALRRGGGGPYMAGRKRRRGRNRRLGGGYYRRPRYGGW